MKRFGAACLFAALVPVACANSTEDSPPTEPDNGFTSGANGDGGDGGRNTSTDDASPPVLQCVDTVCPFPYTTCETDKPVYKCEINLLNDPNNCGECGVSCDSYEPMGMKGQCVKGRCDFQCLIYNGDPTMVLKNCNGILDDGCEIDVFNDPNNCGICGNKCNEGDDCIQGRCGCPAGYVKCNGECIDLTTNDNNCGACGNRCPFWPESGQFANCEIVDMHAQGKCMDSTCGHLTCSFGWGDCDTDMNTCSEGPLNENGHQTWSGCETSLVTTENCGACGHSCDPGQVCRIENFQIKCVDTCEKLNLTNCGSKGEYGGGCRDLNNDKHYCGSCLNDCPKEGAHQTVECRKGSCEYPCEEGYADCNGDATDGCEVNTMVNPGNCGACGNACDLAQGQPCVDGKCLTKDCYGDGGTVTR